jgi:hypothetical protein
MTWSFDGNWLRHEPSGKMWPARSGGSAGNSRNVSYGPDGRALRLPRGTYRILRESATEKISDPLMQVPGSKKYWWVPLKPTFPTERGTKARGQFGIHPDGGLPGTNGCIGVFGVDQEAFALLFAMLKNSFQVGYVVVSYMDEPDSNPLCYL